MKNVTYLYTFRDERGIYKDVWAATSDDAVLILRRAGLEPKGFYCLYRVTNVSPKESE